MSPGLNVTIKRNKISNGSPVANVFIYLVVLIMSLSAVWPFIYVISLSVSETSAVLAKKVWLLPKGFDLLTYKVIIKDMSLWLSYRNTIIYAVSATCLTCLTSVLAAYPLAKKGLYLRKYIVYYMVITMYFGGGLIPSFILMTKLGLYGSPLVMIIPSMVGIFYIILVRTYFTTHPESLRESAYLDGASDFKVLFSIYVPISKPIIAVIALYAVVNVWNSWFNAFLYLPANEEWHPLQLYLRKVLISEKISDNIVEEFARSVVNQDPLIAYVANVKLKYAIIIFTSLPIICSYPFLQKYFVKGIMVGSLKE